MSDPSYLPRRESLLAYSLLFPYFWAMTGYFDSFLLSSLVAVFLGLISEKLADCISVDAYVSIVNLVMGQGQGQNSQVQAAVAAPEFNCDKPLPPEPIQEEVKDFKPNQEQVQCQVIEDEEHLLQQEPPKEQDSHSEQEEEDIEQEIVQEVKQEVNLSSFSDHQHQVEKDSGHRTEDEHLFVADEPAVEVVQEQVENLLESKQEVEQPQPPVELEEVAKEADDLLNVQVKQEPVDPYKQEEQEFAQHHQEEPPLMTAEQIKKEPFDPYEDHHSDHEEVQEQHNDVVKSELEDEVALVGAQKGTAQHVDDDDIPAATSGFNKPENVSEDLVTATKASQDCLLQSQLAEVEEPLQQQQVMDDFQTTEQHLLHMKEDQLHQPSEEEQSHQPQASFNDDVVNLASSAPTEIPPPTHEQHTLFDQDFNVKPTSDDHQFILEEVEKSVSATSNDQDRRGDEILDNFTATSNVAESNIVREEVEEERNLVATEVKESSQDNLVQSDHHHIQPEESSNSTSDQLLDFQSEPFCDQTKFEQVVAPITSEHDNQHAVSDLSAKEPSSSVDELLQDQPGDCSDKPECGQDLLQQEMEHFHQQQELKQFQEQQHDFQVELQPSTVNDDLAKLPSAPPAVVQDEEVQHKFMEDEKVTEEDKHADMEGDSSSSPFDDLGASSKPTSPGETMEEEQAKPFSPTTTALEDYELKSDGSGGTGDHPAKSALDATEIRNDDVLVKHVEDSSNQEDKVLSTRHEEEVGGFDKDPVSTQPQPVDEQHMFEDDIMVKPQSDAMPTFSDQTDFGAVKPNQLDQISDDEHQDSVNHGDFGVKESQQHVDDMTTVDVMTTVDTKDGTANLQAPPILQEPRLSLNDDEDDELAAAALNDDDDEDLSDPLEAEKMAYKAKVDEGDPWSEDKKSEVTDAAPATQTLLGEGISSSSSAANLVGGDDVSHRAVFGDEEDPDEKELDLSNKDSADGEKLDMGSDAGISEEFDAAAHQAATKIQAAFKGFKTRSELGSDHRRE